MSDVSGHFEIKAPYIVKERYRQAKNRQSRAMKRLANIATWSSQNLRTDFELWFFLIGRCHVELLSVYFSPDPTGFQSVYYNRTHRVNHEKDNDDIPTSEEWSKFTWPRVSFLHPNFQGTFQKITKEEFKKLQNVQESRPKRAVRRSDGLWTVDKKIWVPIQALGRLLVWNHYRLNHPNIDDELSNLQEFFLGKDMAQLREHLKKFHASCLHCHKFPSIIRRPFHSTWEAGKPNEIIHLDYLKIEGEYLCVLMDNFTRRIELNYNPRATAEAAASGIIWWKSRFELRPNLVIVTDRGSHFVNQLFSCLEKYLSLNHEYSVAYSPWTNGTIERMNRTVLQNFRILLSEYKLTPRQWKDVLPVVQMIINCRKNSRKMNLSPNDLLFGVSPEGTTPLNTNTILSFLKKERLPILAEGAIKLPNTSRNVIECAKKLGEELIGRWEKIKDINHRLKEQKNRLHNRRLGVKDIQFGVGDYVLISFRGVRKQRSKLKLRWVGPYIISKIEGRNTYEVRSPTGKTLLVHSSRMRYYEDKSWQLTEEIKEVFLHDEDDHYIHQIEDIRAHKGRLVMRVEWLGFEEKTWEPILSLYKDVPLMVLDFLNQNRKNKSKLVDAGLKIIRKRTPMHEDD